MLISHRRLFAVIHFTAKQYNRVPEELLGEGYIALRKLEENKNYCAIKDAKKTYYWRWIASLLRHSILTENKSQKNETQIDTNAFDFCPAPNFISEFYFPESLSKESKYVAEMALNIYNEDLKIPSKGELKKKLLKEGWRIRIINKCFAELRKTF